ncbi:MAG: DNA cytosine methyltransferase, partial [Bacilli bacterium]|nr:DNA cytosine methyltransferase [Bacilli bacterium]
MKSQNLIKNEKKMYNLIDLFCGCGGITQGYSQTNRINVVGAIDFNQAACNTYKLNFSDANVICCDIKEEKVEETKFNQVDIIVGGPPCQGFSALNRHNKN